MHSVVFVLVENLEDIENISYPDEVDMANFIGADSIIEEDEKEFKKSVEWLQNCYNLKHVVFQKVKLDYGDKVLVAEISKNELFNAIEKEIQERIEAVKQALNERDLHRVAWEAYNQRGFYFYLDGYDLLNIIDLYRYGKNLNDKLYIIRTYDYHF